MNHEITGRPSLLRGRRAGKAAALTFAAACTMALGSATAAHASTWDGCPDGAVCVYPEGQDSTDTSVPELVLWSYGAHNLSNMYGSHDVINNQTGGASANLCLGYNGTNCNDPQVANNGRVDAQWVTVAVDFTPINSITLNRP